MNKYVFSCEIFSIKQIINIDEVKVLPDYLVNKISLSFHLDIHLNAFLHEPTIFD